MNTLRLQYNKMDIEKMLITIGMAVMEVTGFVLLFCGLLDIKIF